MAKYTLELYDIMKHPIFEVFDFEYDFYTDDINIIENFEKKFLNKYAFYEINNPIVHRWKWQLKAKLDEIMPYYTQLYYTELKSRDIEYLLNKDYRETFIREVDKALIENGSSTENKNSSSKVDTNNTNNNTSDRTTTSQNEVNNKNSNIENGNGSVALEDKFLTGVNQDKENGTGTEKVTIKNTDTENKNGTISENGTTEANKNSDEKLTEKTELIGKGNIGTTSSAELLQKWREVLINIDKLILEELRELFLLVY